MNKVSDFNPIISKVHVESGVTIKELNEKLNSVGFEFPIYFSSQKFSEVGSMIATNSSGDRSMKYGNIKDWIEEIEFVNGKGEIMKTSKADLMDVCGMEGITGIIIGATLRITPFVKRSASVFQSDKLDEILSVARKLKSEKEVVMLELFSPKISKFLEFPEKYNLIIEFDSDRGKIKDEEYDRISKIRNRVYHVLYREGYFNSDDPKLFFDKIKEFISFLEKNNVPYFGCLGTGVVYAFFRDNEKKIKEESLNLLLKMRAKFGEFGIGLTRKNFLDSFDRKVIERIKSRHDPFSRLNKGKVIDSEYTVKRVEIKNDEKEIKPSAVEKKHKSEMLEQLKNTTDDFQDFVKEVESLEEDFKSKSIKKSDFNKSQNEPKIYTVDIGKRIYEPSILKLKEKKEETKIMPKQINSRTEKQNVDYNQINSIMTNQFGIRPQIKPSVPEQRKEDIVDNLGKKNLEIDKKETNSSEKELIDKILKKQFNIDKDKEIKEEK
jgi:hypothetical protein